MGDRTGLQGNHGVCDRQREEKIVSPEARVVHVVGTGTIGEPLIGLLSDFREELGIDEVTYHKRTPILTDRPKCHALAKRGAKLACDIKARRGFQDMGIPVNYETHEALKAATVVIDCTPSGVGRQNKLDFYEGYKDNTRGFIAQGSEFGFGKMYAYGMNDEALEEGKDQYIHVVSCNTHNIGVLIQAVALAAGNGNQLKEARFVCIRRSNDISQDAKFIPSPSVGKHNDETFGTHHARDAFHLFKTLGYELDLFSSAIKMNTQYMHAIHFNIRMQKPITREEVMARLHENERVALTEKKSANVVFSFGRDHGHYGNQAVVVAPTVTVHDEREVVGFCFTPQDGNSILSSVAAACWFLDPSTYQERIQCLNPLIFDEV